MKTAEDFINEWGCKKYNKPAGTVFRLVEDTHEGGFCETCWYSYDVVDVYADDVKIDYMTDVTISDLLREILNSQ